MAGIRPEHFEDAELVGDQAGPTFETTVELLESMGSELYAYFDVETGGATSEQLEELAADTGAELGTGGENAQVVARLDAASKARKGERIKLWLDPERIHFFDLDSGQRINAGGGVR
jgi:multiple sugar transport system ATP-binding protein